MGVLRQVGRDEVHPLLHDAYRRQFGDRDPIAEPGTPTGTKGDWWTTLALTPELTDTFVQQVRLLHGDTALPAALRELALVRVGFTGGSRFVFSQHCKAARGVGVSQEELDAVPRWALYDGFTAIQRLVLQYCDEMVLLHGRTQDDTIAGLRAELGDEGVCELTLVVGIYQMHCSIVRSLRLEYEDDLTERISEVPAPAGFGGVDLARLLGGAPKDWDADARAES